MISISSSRDEAAAKKSGGCSGGTCTCGAGSADLPELDATVIPPALRHATIFGALDSLAPGAGLILKAPHNPLPLLAQLDERAPDGFDVSYLDEGPADWRLRLIRK